MAHLPFFYQDTVLQKGASLSLNEETAKHIVQVLRKKIGDQVIINNGKGDSAFVTLTEVAKKKCSVYIDEVNHHPKPLFGLHLCVAFTKNTSRNEWLLEKACELGVMSIRPIISQRTEREKYREDRWQNILISAMMQSQQYYLPTLYPATKLEEIIEEHATTDQKIIAHCEADFERTAVAAAIQTQQNTVILIGPEGDFSPEEIQMSMQKGFKGIILCTQRLRTETAAMSVCAYFNLLNHV
jgi:16S rRNA (uracil1498-N3)-methyltransferase